MPGKKLKELLGELRRVLKDIEGIDDDGG